MFEGLQSNQHFEEEQWEIITNNNSLKINTNNSRYKAMEIILECLLRYVQTLTLSTACGRNTCKAWVAGNQHEEDPNAIPDAQ